MEKVFFVKDFQMSRRLQRVMIKVPGETDAEDKRRIKISRYGIEGEDRVHYQLKNIYLPMVALSDVRIEEQFGNAQADFVVISSKKVFILEVKNLYGNIRVNQDGEVIRVIPKNDHIEEEGMENPFTQTKRQALLFQRLLTGNGYNLAIDYLIVMGNPRTAISFEGKKYPLIRHDKLKEYFENIVENTCTIQEFQKLVEIGEFIKSRNKERDFKIFDVMHNNMVSQSNQAPLFNNKDLELYEELLEFRRRLAKERGIPMCNIFLNRDAENMVLKKPKTPEELMNIPGIKYKKYLLFGEEVLAIIKKYQ